MNLTMYPLFAALVGCITAQVLKPIITFAFTGKWNWKLLFASGGMPSSHSSTVAAVTLAVGLIEKFNSTLFAVTLVISVIVCFDACNVRYYAGKNIELTEQLINDIKELSILKFDDPIYKKKLKDVLGHTYLEVFAGILLGLLVSYLMYLFY